MSGTSRRIFRFSTQVPLALPVLTIRKRVLDDPSVSVARGPADFKSLMDSQPLRISFLSNVYRSSLWQSYYYLGNMTVRSIEWSFFLIFFQEKEVRSILQFPVALGDHGEVCSTGGRRPFGSWVSCAVGVVGKDSHESSMCQLIDRYAMQYTKLKISTISRLAANL